MIDNEEIRELMEKNEDLENEKIMLLDYIRFLERELRLYQKGLFTASSCEIAENENQSPEIC